MSRAVKASLSGGMVPTMTTLPGQHSATWTCYYCGAAHRDLCAHQSTDHVVPRSRGGSRMDPRNLVLACRTCNASKGARIFPTEWIPGVDDNTFIRCAFGWLPEIARFSDVGVAAVGVACVISELDGTLALREFAAVCGEFGPGGLLVVRKALTRLHTIGGLDLDVSPGLPWQRTFSVPQQGPAPRNPSSDDTAAAACAGDGFSGAGDAHARGRP